MHLNLLRLSLEPLREASFAAWQEAYMLHQFPFLGVRSPLLKRAVKTYISADWRKEIPLLWNEPEREYQYAALQLALHHKKEWVPADLQLFETLICSKSWWDTVDTIAPHLAGALFLRHPELLVNADRWLKSDHLWLRRSAIIFQLRYKEKTDANRLFESCARLGGEKEFFIRKAIGWALREYGKTEPERVKKFLATASLSPLSIREARKHLPNMPL